MVWYEIQSYIFSRIFLLQKIGISILILFMFWVLRRIFSRYIFKILLQIASASKIPINQRFLISFEKPMQMLIIILGFYLAIHNLLNLLPITSVIKYELFLARTLRSFIVVFFAWGIYNLEEGTSIVFEKLQESFKFELDKTLIILLSKTLRFLTVGFAIIIILQEWEYPINGLITGLGLGGLAFALAAKDTVANVFGGIVIIMDKPFSIGDWVKTANGEGTVEDISFRSTRIRTFEQALITLPNSSLANDSIINWSKMGKRRVSFKLGVMYSTPKENLRNCIHDIKEMLVDHPEVHKETILVTFDSFNDSSLDIFLYFFTNTTVYNEYLRVKEDINFKIMEILENNEVCMAFPSKSIYFENELPGLNKDYKLNIPYSKNNNMEE